MTSSSVDVSKKA